MPASNFVPAASQSTNEAVYSGLPGRTNGPADTYRHILWGAELTRRYGESIARLALESHSKNIMAGTLLVLYGIFGQSFLSKIPILKLYVQNTKKNTKPKI